MSDQGELFERRRRPKLNAPLAAEHRDRAMDAVDAAARELEAEWRRQYCLEIQRFAARRRPFLAEDVTAVVGIPDTIDPRAIGPLFRKMQVMGFIRPTGRMPNGQSVSRHRTMMREWIGAGDNRRGEP